MCRIFKTFEDMLRSIDIPCRYVRGQLRTKEFKGSNEWDEKNLVSHAWNEVYINGRWVIIDLTLNSNHNFSKGEFLKADVDHEHYNPSLEAFSDDHIIEGYGKIESSR